MCRCGMPCRPHIGSPAPLAARGATLCQQGITGAHAVRQRIGTHGKGSREWPGRIGVGTLYIEPGSPWENRRTYVRRSRPAGARRAEPSGEGNGYVASFIGSLRDELLRREMFGTLLEAKVLVERWRRHHNEVRTHSSLEYGPPASAAIRPLPPRQ